MDYKASQLTRFAKDCAWGLSTMLNGIFMAEEIAHSSICRDLKNETDEDLLIEISKRFAKYTKNVMSFDADVGEVQDFQSIICQIVDCCEENDWFGNQ